MLAQHHNDAHDQPDCLLFECRRRNLLFYSELVSERLKLLQKRTAAGLPDVVHDSKQGTTRAVLVLHVILAYLCDVLRGRHPEPGTPGR